MERSHQFVRRRGQDRAGLNGGVVFGIVPALPQASEGIGGSLRKVWGGSRTWVEARSQSVLMSVWRNC
jgi:hypothetical protein